MGSLENRVGSPSLSQSWTCVLGEELGFAFGEEQDVTHKCRSALSRMRPAFPRGARRELALFHQKLPPLSIRGSFAKVVSKGLFCKSFKQGALWQRISFKSL